MGKPRTVEAEQPIPYSAGRVVAIAPAQFIMLHMQSLQPTRFSRSGTMISSPSTTPSNESQPTPAASSSSCRATFLVGNASVEVEVSAAQIAELASDPTMRGDYEIQFVRRAPSAENAKVSA